MLNYVVKKQQMHGSTDKSKSNSVEVHKHSKASHTCHKLVGKCSSNDRNTDLSPLACQRRIRECVARRHSPDPAGTQKTDASGWKSTRSQLERPLSPPPYNSTHRACCGEGVGPIGPAAV
ncbi:hypothetical protein EYF80_016543 [Liparis tanakae]|uniref:Uncharacterized protein n=1 Tax=Liparis tanakae TaxID=230148 RepID=A0A4Z2I7F6_9TELE|nr:hypothetical protein EYF80_016543 [Liparis tanakae]